MTVGIEGIIQPHGRIILDVLAESVQGRIALDEAGVVAGLPEVRTWGIVDVVDSAGSGRFERPEDSGQLPVIGSSSVGLGR